MRRQFCLLSWVVILFFKEVSELNGIVQRSLLDQFASSFDRANGLSIFQFDAIHRLFSKRFWLMGKMESEWIRNSCFVFNFWNSKIKIYVGAIVVDATVVLVVDAIVVDDAIMLMLLLCWFWVLNRVARSQLLRLFDDGSDNTALLSWFLLKIRSASVRILDRIVCSGSLVRLFSPAWDAVKLTLPGGWLHLSFRGHWPYQFRSDDGNCSELAPGLMFDDFLPISDADSLPFLPFGIKASRVWSICTKKRGNSKRNSNNKLKYCWKRKMEYNQVLKGQQKIYWKRKEKCCLLYKK